MLESSANSRTFYEFFAGSGMVREGLGDSWRCFFANDCDEKKATAYEENWGGGELLVCDVGRLKPRDLPGRANLAWASFPCQDLSLAGNGAGLKGRRSGTFWPFWGLIRDLRMEGRQPDAVVLENVCGALTSHKGADFRSLISALGQEGYRTGALVIDAALFVPQSRPRLFIIGIRDDIEIDSRLVWRNRRARSTPNNRVRLRGTFEGGQGQMGLVEPFPAPPSRVTTFSSVIEDDIPWHSSEQTRALLALMLPLHRAKIAAAKKQARKS